MTEQQIPQLAGALVTHQRHFGALSTHDAQWAIQNTATAIALWVNAIRNRGNVVEKRLEFVATTSVAAIESFKSFESFKKGKKGPVQIYSVSDDFKKHFGGKEEGASEAVDLKIHKLLVRSLDVLVIKELADKFEITLGQFFALLKKQGKGEAGVLLLEGYNVIIAYIRDDEGILWAVFAFWDTSRGWCIDVHSIAGVGWLGSSRVLSR
ncbi:MAG: hypothetical protein JWO50_459 [Candidatus Kaiserbacteria bacterium]|nr:hypothetical protein [Candidatus Kaiserbacteria bacterium]